QDIWLEYRDAHNQNIEITGYPTEKNPALLARIIEASSNPGDLVLDCFSGSGTTLAVAAQLNRRWIGIDDSVEAISTTLRRFAKGLEPMGDFVDRQETQEQLIQKSLQWDNAEKPIEAEKYNKIAAANGHHIINNFSLRAIESFAGDLDTVLQQWLEWQ
ncbi:MAG TPA: site-specific DNA-methyltransferase, partial [Ktedonobacteraceae bacterium]|nr:site-specific DNA-methyltransferase [Ktedonobacteraceae bacterium]